MEIDASQEATALLTEHLQYTPLSLIDDIIDSVNNFVYQGVGSLESGLFSTAPERLGFRAVPTHLDSNDQAQQDFPEAKQEIEEGLHKLETLLNSTVDKNFDKFEIYVLRNILSVPQDLTRWIRLSHYESIQLNPHEKEYSLESIPLLRQKLVASRNFNRVLQREHQKNEAILDQLRAMITSVDYNHDEPNFSFLSHNGDTQSFTHQSQNPLTTSTTFTMSQLPTLRSALTDLRSKLALLKQIPASVDTAKDERREERREYIEQRTRLHLERNGQTFSDDASTVGGRNIDQHEINAMERMAEILHPT